MAICAKTAIDGLELAYFTPNAWIDAAFYNVGCLDTDELKMLAWIGKLHNEPPGTIVQVAPGRSHGRPQIKVVIARDWFQHVDDSIDTVVVAGVGSSILGTAALAKDVADQIGKPVIGLVTGTGASGALIDTLIGGYCYTPINWLNDWMVALAHDAAAVEHFDESIVKLEGDLAGPTTPEEILKCLITRPTVSRAIGHSKGSLQLAVAVLASEPELKGRISPLKVGTLGAVDAMPDYVQSCQVLGELDWLGQLVSVPSARHLLAGRSHSLNPNLPFGFGISLKDDVWGKFGAATAFA
jgi:hypothetical protein